MKSLLINTLAFLTIFQVQAQIFGNRTVKGNGETTHITKNVDTYDELSVGGNFDIVLYNGTSGNLDIEIDDNLVDLLDIKSNNGRLSIHWQNNKDVQPQHNTIIRIPVEDLEKISLLGDGTISSEDTLENVKISINLTGNGNIALHINTDDVTSRLIGSGTIQLSGKTGKMNLFLSGSGNYKCFDFESTDAAVKVSGSGRMEINVVDSLSAIIAGSGDIFYKGNPELEEDEVLGTGVLKKVDD